ncbi:hypothetical protein LINGRAHAP2_LOCUS28100 [Linum grandiflorum]
MATPSKSSIFLLFALFVAVSFSNVEVGTSARILLQIPYIPGLPLPEGLPMPPVPKGPNVPIPVVTGAVAGVPIPKVPVPGN